MPLYISRAWLIVSQRLEGFVSFVTTEQKNKFGRGVQFALHSHSGQHIFPQPWIHEELAPFYNQLQWEPLSILWTR